MSCHLTLRQTPYKSKFRKKPIFIPQRKADLLEMKFNLDEIFGDEIEERSDKSENDFSFPLCEKFSGGN